MKQFTKRALFMLMCVTLLSTFIFAQGKVEIDGIYYYLNNNEASVSSNPDLYSGDLTIPESIIYNGKNYSVTKIGQIAFMNCIDLTSIYIPGSVKSIGTDAFDGCKNLASVTLNNGLQTIENSSFSGCFKSIVIPSSVNSVGKTVFGNCPNLTSLVVESGNTKYDSRDNCNAIIETATNKLIAGCAGSFIPTSVTTLAKCSFECVQGLTSIIIPSSVKTIEYGAFHNCKDLKQITLSNGLTTINWGAFEGTSIEGITIPSSVKKIEFDSMHPNILGNCPNLVSIVVEEGNTVYDSRENCNAIIEKSTNTLISGCKNTIIPNSVKSIRGAFDGCSGLSSITIPNSVTNIEHYAFRGCIGLVDIYCYAEQPPVASSSTTYSIFDSSHYSNTTLHVLASSVDAYKIATIWKKFENIVSIMPTHWLKYFVDGAEYKSFEVEEGATITPEATPTKEGYTFSGWSEIPETMPAHDVTVTGTFSINSYKLTYIIDDEVYKEVTYEYGATITPEATPEGNYTSFEWVDLPETMPAYDVQVHARYEVTGIDEIMMSQSSKRIYSPNGKQLDQPQKGINIIKIHDGTTRKVVIK